MAWWLRATISWWRRTAGETLGWDVAWAGDLNGDGVGDIVIGALDDNGRIRVFFGGGT